MYSSYSLSYDESRSLIFASGSIYHFQSEELKQKMRILLVQIHRIQ